MNLFYRVLVAVYALISTILSAIVLVSPFSDKQIMLYILEYIDVTFYRSNQYNVMVFLVGIVFLALNVAILTSGIRGKGSNKYYATKNETGLIKISANAVENIALQLSRRYTGVKEAKAKVKFKRSGVEIAIKLAVFPDVHVPNLCKNIQDRVKESVETAMDIEVCLVDISVDSVHTAVKSEG